MIERDAEAVQQMGACFGLAQLELNPPAHDLAAELDELLDDFEKRQHLRPAADNRQHDDAEVLLQLRVLVQVVEDDVRDLAALQFDDDAHPIAVGFVANVRDPLDHLVADQIGDALLQPRLVHLIRDLVDDDLLAIAASLERFDLHLGAHLH